MNRKKHDMWVVTCHVLFVLVALGAFIILKGCGL